MAKNKYIFFLQKWSWLYVNGTAISLGGESWKDWPPLRGLPTDPRSTDYPTDYSTDYPTDYPYGLPLIINQIPFYGVEKYKKHTCSTYTIRTETAAIFFSDVSN